MGVGVIV